MATKIKLMRLGKMRAPYYRIVVADARTKRDGRAIETIGKYHPKDNPSLIQVDAERAAYWLGVGAQPTEAVQKILSKTGDWQRFKGEPAPEPLLVAEPKPDKREAFAAAAQESLAESGAATTPKKKTAKKAAADDKDGDKDGAKDAGQADEKPSDAPAAEATGTTDAADASETTAAPEATETPDAPAAEAPAGADAGSDAETTPEQ